MKKLAFGLLLLLMGMGSLALAAGSKTFNSSGQILPGESWDNVDIYGNDTVVDMLGGYADGVVTYDSSTFNMLDGHADIIALQTSTVNVSGGSCTSVRAWEDSTVYVQESASITNLISTTNGVVFVYGGGIDRLGADDASVIHVYGGIFANEGLDVGLGASDDSFVYFYGLNMLKTSVGGLYGYGEVTGQWDDDTAFVIPFQSPETHGHVVLVPEPSLLGLLILGGAISGRRK